MNMSRHQAMALVSLLALAPVPALAADSTLVLVLAGEAYDGPPKFSVAFDGKPIGEASVAAAIDTATAGRLADASDRNPFVQTFSFSVPEATFRPEGAVTVQFLNEANGGPGVDRDRNLYLASVGLNGRVVTASGLQTISNGKPVPNQMLGEFVVLADSSKNGVSPPPPGGWPAPSGAPASDATTTASIPVKAEAVETLATAALDPDPEAAVPACDLNEKYNVIGFNENSNELTPPLLERLDQVAADIGPRQCKVTVTGYSSKQGPIASNALFAIERAQNALTYLQQKGVKFARASATGVGATDEFGPDFRSNRRVVITVSP